MKTTYLSLLSVLVLASACGGKSSGGGAQKEESKPQTTVTNSAPQKVEGSYRALLRPLNTDVSGFLPSGAAEIKVVGDQMTVTTYLDDDSKIVHIQSIQEGTVCPTLTNDSNKDGFVDIVEAYASAGKVLIPLDSDLNSQKSGEGIYPIGKSFTYVKSAKVSLLVDDLYRPDELAGDQFTKLANGAPLNLEGRVVIVSGTSDLTRVPESVQTIDGKPRNVTIPVACGVLKRL